MEVAAVAGRREKGVFIFYLKTQHVYVHECTLHDWAEYPATRMHSAWPDNNASFLFYDRAVA